MRAPQPVTIRERMSRAVTRCHGCAMKPPRHFVRTGHGAGEGQPHVEIPRDGMPSPVAGPPALPVAPLVFRKDGTIGDSATAKALGSKGGQAKARNLRLVDSLGVAKLAEDSAFAPYRTGADHFVDHHLAELASLAGGVVGSGPSSMVASAALQLAGSRYCFDQFAASGDAAMMKLGSSLANDSRQNLLAAYSHAVLEAEGRKKVATQGPTAPWFQPEGTR